MHITVEALRHIIEQNQLLAYLVIFLFVIFEGEIIAITAGILILLGGLNLWFSLIAILAGGLIKTFTGYYIGQLLKNKFAPNRFFAYVERRVLGIMPHFEKKPFWSIFISKFLMINHVVIIFAGYKKIDFKKYLQAEIFSTVIWAISLLALGYFFSYTALRLSRRFSEFLLIIVLFIVAFYLLEKIITILFDVFENILQDDEQ